MKCCTTTFLCAMSLAAAAQPMRASFGLLNFDSPTTGAYVEMQTTFSGKSLVLAPAEPGTAGVRATVGVQQLITKGQDTIYLNRYKLNGPTSLDSANYSDFVSVDRRALKDGKYDVMLTLFDLNDPFAVPVSIGREIVVDHRDRKPYLSDIELVASMSPTTTDNSLSKSGYDLIPYSSDLYSAGRNELIFYCEMYNMDRRIGASDDFVVSAFVENADDGRAVSELGKFFKLKAASVVPVLHRFNIADLPSGNYNLVIDVRDHNNNQVDARKMPIYRSNPQAAMAQIKPIDMNGVDIEKTFLSRYNRPEELAQYIDYLYPISSDKERVFEFRKVNNRDVNMMKQFFYQFWMQRDPIDPAGAWDTYHAEVKKANEAYSNNLMKGYRSDRGRVFLQYGPPNSLVPNYFEPNSWPYEIWHYYTLDDKMHPRQSNKKFVFANMEAGARDFKLIHSDAFDELRNDRWNYDLHKRNNAYPNFDEERGRDYVGNKTLDMYNNPR